MKNNPLLVFEELEDFVLSFEGDENELNTEIYRLIRVGHLSLDLFLEYQGITQADVTSCFEENKNEQEGRNQYEAPEEIECG